MRALRHILGKDDSHIRGRVTAAVVALGEPAVRPGRARFAASVLPRR